MQPLCRAGLQSDQLPQILERAIRVAVGQRGVAVVVIPGDVALKPTDAATGRDGCFLRAARASRRTRSSRGWPPC